MLQEIRSRGVLVHFITLHVGLGTFAPVKVEDLTGHVMHEERFELNEATAHAINNAKSAGHRVFAVGTTTVRVLETVASCNQPRQESQADASPRPPPLREGRGGIVASQSKEPAGPERWGASLKFPLSASEGERAGVRGQPRIVLPTSGKTRIFIHPPYDFKVVDALLTNFHLPRSTLLMLVSAFAAPGEARGREMTRAAYAQAIRERYRFFSYGDAMLVL
jgi:S-adenosylmethionine:tRNA ribosyltransferase-isomerase